MVNRSISKYLILWFVAVGMLMNSCVAERDEHTPEISAIIGYGVNLNADFRKPSTKAGDNGFAVAGKEVRIEQLSERLGERTLYLHTITEEWKGESVAKADEGVVVGKGVETKGSIILPEDLTDNANYNGNIAVSGWVYDGDAASGYAGGQQYFVNDVLSSPYASTRYWPQLNDHIMFYAYAPTDVQSGEKDNNGVANYVTLPSDWGENNVPSFDFVVPNNITEQSDLLVSSALVSKADFGKEVDLTFYHALTAVQFKVEDLDKLLIKSVELSGVRNAETYTYAHNTSGSGDYEDGSWSSTGPTDGEYILDFTQGELEGKDGIENNNGFLFQKQDGADPTVYTLNEENFILFMMPQQLSEGATVTLRGYDTVREEDVTLSASIGGEGKEWKKGQLVVYKISVSDVAVEYVFEIDEVSTVHQSLIADPENDSIPVVETAQGNIVEVVPFYGQVDRKIEVKSYKRVYKLGVIEPQIVPLEWEIDETATPIPNWFDAFSGKSGNGVSDEASVETITYNVVAQTPQCTSHTNLTKKTEDITNNSYQTACDLSLSTKEGTTSMNTANCYIVSGPGYYKLPLVYGNAIKEGVNNTSSYSVTAAEGTVSGTLVNGDGTAISAGYNVLGQFYNYAGPTVADGTVDDPWITADKYIYAPELVAEVVWEDEPCLITEAKVDIEEQYLYFRVREDCICEGNAVVAVKDDDGNENRYASGGIVWSWHIWVTDKDNETMSLTANVDYADDAKDVDATFSYKRGFELMPVPLGYCNGEEKRYEPRSATLTFVQYEDGEARHSASFNVVQVGDNEMSVEHPDNVLYYQYGRKDPIISAYNHPTLGPTNKPFYTGLRGRYSKGYGGGRVGFHQLSETETIQIGHGISNPGKMFESPQLDLPSDEVLGYTLRMYTWYGQGYMSGVPVYVNLWNSNNTFLPMFTYLNTPTSVSVYSNFSAMVSYPPVKTIYDPSPYGYEVPMNNAFAAFTVGGKNYHGTNIADLGFNSDKYSPGFTLYANGFCTFNFKDDRGKSFSLGAFGYKSHDIGSINSYGEYGGALTANPVCVQWPADVEGGDATADYYESYFLLGSSRLYFMSSRIESQTSVFWPMASSSMAHAFPVMPAVTGLNAYWIDPNQQ